MAEEPPEAGTRARVARRRIGTGAQLLTCLPLAGAAGEIAGQVLEHHGVVSRAVSYGVAGGVGLFVPPFVLGSACLLSSKDGLRKTIGDTMSASPARLLVLAEVASMIAAIAGNGVGDGVTRIGLSDATATVAGAAAGGGAGFIEAAVLCCVYGLVSCCRRSPRDERDSYSRS